MKFKLEIDTGNAAFGATIDERLSEVVRILREAADKLDDGYNAAPLRDANGNTVGEFKFTGR